MIPEIVTLNAGPRKLRLVGRALGVPKRGERLAKQVEGQIATAKREAGDDDSDGRESRSSTCAARRCR